MSFKDMECALRDMKSGSFSIREAAQQYGIAYTTMRTHAIKNGISVKAVSFNFFVFFRSIDFRMRYIVRFVQATRSYVKTENNLALRQAVELVLWDGVPTNTASIIKKIARTTLYKELLKYKKMSTTKSTTMRKDYSEPEKISPLKSEKKTFTSNL